jgi:molecular chaperone GrpE
MKDPQVRDDEEKTRSQAQEFPTVEANGQAPAGEACEQEPALDEQVAQPASTQSEEAPELQEQAPGEETVESLTEQLEAQKDKYIRLMAEFDNFKRRTAKEYERIVESANERLMLQIIEAREGFERALKVEQQTTDFKTFLDGMKLVFAKLDDALSRNGLTVFAEVGDEFDPMIHDAMMKTPHEEIPEDHVVEIYEKGYKLRKHVIKHAKVIVSSGKPEAEQGQN